MSYIDLWPLVLFFFHILKCSSAAMVITKPILPPNIPASEFLGPDLQSNYSISPYLLARYVAAASTSCLVDRILTRTSNLTDRPGSYLVPGASSPTSLRIAWHYGELPRQEFDKLILRALNTVVDIVINKPAGDSPVGGDRITFRSPNCHIQATSESRYSMTYSTLATVLRGIGEVMGTWGSTQADILVDVNARMVARVSVEFNRSS